MKKILYLIALIGLISCQNKKDHNRVIREFFHTMSHFECVDSSMNKVNLVFDHSFFNRENMSIEYRVPDSIKHSEFYNAYAGRLVSAFYKRINSDTTVSLEKLLTVSECNEQSARKKVVDYCATDKTLHGIFALSETSFYDNDNLQKEKITADSLINISMSFFDLAGYSKEKGFAFHFVCGTNPFEFTYENRTALLICDFCREALKNPKMSEVYSEITDSIYGLITEEHEHINDFQEIKQAYEPKLHELLKKEQILKESLISYYEQRKEIEPFILEY